jgi:hypothetical protein
VSAPEADKDLEFGDDSTFFCGELYSAELTKVVSCNFELLQVKALFIEIGELLSMASEGISIEPNFFPSGKPNSKLGFAIGISSLLVPYLLG